MEINMFDILVTILVILIIILLWIAIYDTHRFIVVNHSFSDSRIKKSCRAVVIADLHNKCYGKNNELLLKAIHDNKPDFVLICGDIPTAKPNKSLNTAISLVRELVKDYPVYYGNGNHEHRMKLYPETYQDMGERYEAALKQLGVHLLVNEKISLPQAGLCIYGSQIDKSYYKRFGISPMEGNYLESILGKKEEDKYGILLAHNPDYFLQYAAWGADLVLSGHVHGGMVRIPFWGKGMVSPNIRLFPRYDGGCYQKDKTTMLVSRGLGMHTIPIRIFNPGELLVIDLLPQNAKEVFLENLKDS